MSVAGDLQLDSVANQGDQATLTWSIVKNPLISNDTFITELSNFLASSNCPYSTLVGNVAIVPGNDLNNYLSAAIQVTAGDGLNWSQVIAPMNLVSGDLLQLDFEAFVAGLNYVLFAANTEDQGASYYANQSESLAQDFQDALAGGQRAEQSLLAPIEGFLVTLTVLAGILLVGYAIYESGGLKWPRSAPAAA